MSKNVFNLKTYLEDRLKKDSYQKSGKTVEAFHTLIEIVFSEMIEEAIEAMIEEGKGRVTLKPEDVEKTSVSRSISTAGYCWLDERKSYEERQLAMNKKVLDQLDSIRAKIGGKSVTEPEEDDVEYDDDAILERIDELEASIKKEFKAMKKKLKWMEG